jgi:putative transposase
MVGPSGRRRAVIHLLILRYSERRACRLLGQARSTQRYERKPPTERSKRVRKLILKFARQFPRYGSRRLTQEVRPVGHIVNGKFVRRICREEGLKIVRKARKRRRGSGPRGERAIAERRSHVWSYDFVFDELEDGRQLKILPIVDNFTRECLAIHVAHNITARDVVHLLQALVRQHGAPAFMRSDNGPEFIARAVREWLDSESIACDYIEPASPWQNAYSESFNSRFRDELLNREIFTSLTEARMLIEEHRRFYNQERRHSSLGYRTPAEFAALCQSSPTAASATTEEKSKASAREKAKPAAPRIAA